MEHLGESETGFQFKTPSAQMFRPLCCFPPPSCHLLLSATNFQSWLYSEELWRIMENDVLTRSKLCGVLRLKRVLAWYEIPSENICCCCHLVNNSASVPINWRWSCFLNFKWLIYLHTRHVPEQLRGDTRETKRWHDETRVSKARLPWAFDCYSDSAGWFCW